jgi:hypothetical protein
MGAEFRCSPERVYIIGIPQVHKTPRNRIVWADAFEVAKTNSYQGFPSTKKVPLRLLKASKTLNQRDRVIKIKAAYFRNMLLGLRLDGSFYQQFVV